MAPQGNNRSDPPKGFAGLSSLVSQVEDLPTPALTEGPLSAATANREGTEDLGSTPAAGRVFQSSQTHSPTSGSGAKWVIGALAIGVVLWMVNQESDDAIPSSTATSPLPDSVGPSTSSAIAVPATMEREQRPSAGTDRVLSLAQIRYCVSEEIRLDGAEGAVATKVEADVDRFNAMIFDYNSRCSSFRYRDGTLERIQAEVEGHRAQLETDGAARFPSGAATIRMMEEPQANAAPDRSELVPVLQHVPKAARPSATDTPQSVPAAQLDARAALSRSEHESLEAACSADKYSSGPVAYERCIAAQLSALEGQPPRPNLSTLSAAERESINATCSTEKYSNGPAAYNRCLRRQLASLAESPSRPNLSTLSVAERESIEAVCSTDKYSNGPAAYNRCRQNQLAILDGTNGRPNLSSLTKPERESIEAVCSTDKYSYGPAAYNACLSRQMSSLSQ